MPSDWHDPDTARRWDRSATARNPVRAEQLDILAALLAKLWTAGDWLLDLGYGSGQVEELLLGRIPAACAVGIDSSEAMMEIARTRLAAYGPRFVAVRHDLAALGSLRPPPRRYRFAIAVQSLHHLSPAEMRDAYGWLAGQLGPGGLFLLLDRVRVESEAVWPAMRAVWERLDALHGSGVAAHEGEDFAAHEATVAERGDRPVLLDEHSAWLRAAGFEPACLHVHGHRALVAAVVSGPEG